MCPLLFGLLVIFLVPVEGQDGAYFLHRGTVYTSYSSWVISYTFNLEHYQTHLDELRNSVENYIDIISSPENKFGNVGGLVAERLRRELEQFSREYDRIYLFFDNIKLALTEKKRRTPRALIPAFGGLMSQLFGVATQKSLRAVKQYIVGLSDAQDSLSHVVEQSLTIVNRTINHVKRNEVALNKLITITNNMKTDISQLSAKVKELEPQMLYNRLMSLVHDTVHGITNSLREIYFDLSQLNLFTSQLIDGKLPVMLVPPEELYKTLMEIERQLPRALTLPYPLSDVKSYYKSLHTMLVPGQNFELHIITAVPLVRQDSVYELFEAVTVPIPCEEQPRSLTYTLESNYVALATDRQTYMVPNSAYAQLCIGTHLTFCNLKYPVLNVNNYYTCIYSLISRNINKIMKYCTMNSIPRDSMPTVKYLMEGKWIISTGRRFNYDVICNEFESTKYVDTKTVTPGISMLQLNFGCSARSRFFYVPSRFRKEETLRSLVLFDHELDQHLNFPSILTMNLSIYSEPVTADSEMSTVTPIDYGDVISNLRMKIQNITKERVRFDHMSYKTFVNKIIVIILFVVIGVCLCATLGVFIFKRRSGAHYCAVSGSPTTRERQVSRHPEEANYLHATKTTPRPFTRTKPKKSVSFNRRDGVVII